MKTGRKIYLFFICAGKTIDKGIIIGLPAGVGVLHLLLALLASEYELKMILGALTYCVSILLTFGVSLVVGLLVARKNKKINMVEALKGVE